MSSIIVLILIIDGLFVSILANIVANRLDAFIANYFGRHFSTRTISIIISIVFVICSIPLIYQQFYQNNNQQSTKNSQATSIPVPPTEISQTYRKIAFVASEHIEIFDEEEGKSKSIPGLNTSYSPAWSPDGKRIAFVSPDDQLYSINEDGSDRRLLTKDSYNGVPSWSNDGQNIVFQSCNFQNTQCSIHVINSKTLKEEVLTASESTYPRWSPDGQKILFVKNAKEIWIMNPDGTESKPLFSQQEGIDFGPCWSPNGTQIAFLSKEKDNQPADIYITDLQGTSRRQLTSTIENEGVPSWSPDGHSLAFQQEDSSGHRSIWIVPTDRIEAPRLFINNSASNYWPAWSPIINRK